MCLEVYPNPVNVRFVGEPLNHSNAGFSHTKIAWANGIRFTRYAWKVRWRNGQYRYC